MAEDKSGAVYMTISLLNDYVESEQHLDEFVLEHAFMISLLGATFRSISKEDWEYIQDKFKDNKKVQKLIDLLKEDY